MALVLVVMYAPASLFAVRNTRCGSSWICVNGASSEKLAYT